MIREPELANFAEWNPNPIVELDPEGGIVYANLTARTQFPDLITEGIHHPILSGLDKIISDFHPHVKADFVVFNREIKFKKKSYEEQIFSLPGSGIYIYIVDITERNRLRSQAHFSDKMAAIGTLAAGVAHEINNPITWILGNLSLLQDYASQLSSLAKDMEEKTLSEKIDEISGEALQGMEQIRDLTRSLKELSRIDKAEVAPVDIHKILNLTITMASVEYRTRAQLVKKFADHLPLILSNSGKLNQVFLNLLINAAQAIPPGDLPHHRITVSTQTEQSRLRIDIEDTGDGIPPEILPKIFDPFFTTKPVGLGTGLGLSICQEIIHELNGEIKVQSTVGKGTTFSVYLPMQLDALQIPENIQAPPVALQRRSILVVDNEPALLKLLDRILGARHQVTTAQSGDHAKELIDKDPRQFDLIISDLNMPDFSGADLYREVIQKHPDLARKFLFVTGGIEVPWAKDFLTRTGVPVLEKPFLPKEILSLVDKLVVGH